MPGYGELVVLSRVDIKVFEYFSGFSVDHDDFGVIDEHADFDMAWATPMPRWRSLPS